MAAVGDILYSRIVFPPNDADMSRDEIVHLSSHLLEEAVYSWMLESNDSDIVDEHYVRGRRAALLTRIACILDDMVGLLDLQTVEREEIVSDSLSKISTVLIRVVPHSQ